MNILNKLTIKHLKMNKKRTIVTIVGIILSTALMVGIGAIASSFRDNALKQTIESNGDYHVKISNVPYENIKYIENHIDMKRATFGHSLGYAYLEDSQNEGKPYLYVEEVSDNYFENIKVTRGRLPENNTEIILSEHIQSNAQVNFELGDTITLELGKRIVPAALGLDDVDQTYGLQEGEYLSIQDQKTYTIVGFMPRLNEEPYQAPGYTVLTKLDPNTMQDGMVVDATITYQHINKIHEKTEQLAESIGISFEESDGVKYFDGLSYNESLLAFYGESSFAGINETLTAVVAVVLFLIMAGCSIVIYNSFAISVMERKKQFGLFSSIGATKSQLKKTVFYEAFLVSLIGIPLGVLSGIFGIWIVLQITNSLLPDAFSFPLTLSLYPSFIILPIIYMIITILISAYLPSRAASKISPIEAIRLNDDIKVKRKTVKTNHFVEKCFGIEGELARKNMKRNKKKYRITILSLVISIVLFVSFSTFVEYVSRGTNSLLEIRNYDIIVQQNTLDETSDEIYQNMLQVPGIDKKISFETVIMTFDPLSGAQMYGDAPNTTDVIVLNQQDYLDYLDRLNLNSKDYVGQIRPILVNEISEVDYENMKIKNRKIFSNNQERQITFMGIYDSEEVDYEEAVRQTFPLTVVDEMPSEAMDTDFAQQIKIILSKEMMNLIEQDSQKFTCCHRHTSLVMAEDHAKVYDEMEAIGEEILGENQYEVYAFDMTANTQLQKNLVFVIGMFLYGFIALVTLIGVTSVFNTIHTSMALRRKEFAVLRSVGLTPKGFNKMLCYESVFYGLKALLIGLPISFVIIVLFHFIFMNVVSFTHILFPWKAIIIAIVAVFLITFITMMYATHKIKKENILDAIREENI